MNIVEPEIYRKWREEAKKIADRAAKLGLPEDTPLKVIRTVEEKRTTISPALIGLYNELKESREIIAKKLGLPENTPIKIVNAEKKRTEIIKLANGELDDNTSWNDIMHYFESKENFNGLVTAANWWVKQLGLASQEASNKIQRLSPERINMFKATLISRMIQEIELEENINISYDYFPDMFLKEACDLIDLKSTPKCPNGKHMNANFQKITVNGEPIYSNLIHGKVNSNDRVNEPKGNEPEGEER